MKESVSNLDFNWIELIFHKTKSERHLIEKWLFKDFTLFIYQQQQQQQHKTTVFLIEKRVKYEKAIWLNCLWFISHSTGGSYI